MAGTESQAVGGIEPVETVVRKFASKSITQTVEKSTTGRISR